jgi:hypothetical protein
MALRVGQNAPMDMARWRAPAGRLILEEAISVSAMIATLAIVTGVALLIIGAPAQAELSTNRG